MKDNIKVILAIIILGLLISNGFLFAGILDYREKLKIAHEQFEVIRHSCRD